jgi:hypothetical protein
MARNYAFNNNATCTQSSTLPLATLISTANIRPRVYEINISSDATPADNSCGLALQRCTTAGTPGSTPTPTPLDPGDPAAQTTTGLAVFGGGPTLTSGVFPWKGVVYQRAAYRWACKDGKEIVLPATANNGIALMALVTNGSAYNLNFGLTWEE